MPDGKFTLAELVALFRDQGRQQALMDACDAVLGLIRAASDPGSAVHDDALYHALVAILAQRNPRKEDKPVAKELTDIAGEIQGETAAAYRFFDGARLVWLPKSQCEWDADEKTMTMPIWLANEKELI